MQIYYKNNFVFYITDMKTIKMLSLDTSTTSTGVAIWKNAKLHRHFCVKTNKNSETKADDMITYITTLIHKENPQIIVCEDLNVVNNIAVAKNLAKIIGAIKGICEYTDMFFFSLPSSKWRKLICDGNTPPKKRAELKPWDIEQAKRLFNIIPECDDDADACLIGEAYIRLFKEDSYEEN